MEVVPSVKEPEDLCGEGQCCGFHNPKAMWLDALYGDVKGEGASKRYKTGTQMGKGEVGRGEPRSGQS